MIKQFLVSLAEPFYLNIFMPFIERNGLILYGKGGGKSSASTLNPEVAEIAKQGVFKPYTLTTGTGTSSYAPETGFMGSVSQPYQNIQQAALQGTQELLPQYLAAVQQQPDQFAFNADADQLTKDYFAQQSALLQPEFQQQNEQMKNTLFGSGRMGLSLSGESVGAGGGGLFNPDTFGLARAQSQTLAGVGAQSRQMALADAASRYGLESGAFGINAAQQQQRTANLGAGMAGMFGTGSGVSEIEANLMKLGLSAEQARSVASAQAAQAMSSGAAQPEQDSGSGKGLIGSLAMAGATAYAGPAVVAGGSDIRLKDNIQHVETDKLGVNWYTWEWNKIATSLGLDKGLEYGVIAQEVKELFPEVVSKASDGYYRVNYDLLASKLVEAA
jgi:hypothetical protein